MLYCNLHFFSLSYHFNHTDFNKQCYDVWHFIYAEMHNPKSNLLYYRLFYFTTRPTILHLVGTQISSYESSFTPVICFRRTQHGFSPRIMRFLMLCCLLTPPISLWDCSHAEVSGMHCTELSQLTNLCPCLCFYGVHG